jgi:hypothetical protein
VRRSVFAVLLLLATAASAQEEKGLNNLANGFAVDKTYQLNDLDQISAFNGNLSINIPLGEHGSGRGSDDVRIRLGRPADLVRARWRVGYGIRLHGDVHRRRSLP